jgi:hypothetical protein
MGIHDHMSDHEWVRVVRDHYLADGHTFGEMVMIGMRVQQAWDECDQDFDVKIGESHCVPETLLYWMEDDLLTEFWLMVMESWGYTATRGDKFDYFEVVDRNNKVCHISQPVLAANIQSLTPNDAQ